MVVNDYLTLFLTLQSWIISNKIFYLLSSANLLVLPLVFIIFTTMTEAMQEGEDEGNKGLLSLNRSAVGLTLAVCAYLFAMIPNQRLNLATLTYNDVRSNQCGVAITKPGDNTQTSWDSAFTSLGGETALVPIWWKLMHNLSVGITNASIAAIPCSYDVTRSQLKLSEVSIQSPALQQETQQFYQQCFAQAKSTMVHNTYQNDGVTDEDFKKANWLGDDYFLSTNPKAMHTTYSGIQALDPVPSFPYKESRDKHYNDIWAERLRAEPKQHAYPTCQEWWTDNTYGLRNRLANEIKKHSPEIYRDVMQPQGWFDTLFNGKKTPEQRKDMLVRRALSTENINATGRTTRGYGAVIDGTGNDRAAAEIWGVTAGSAGLVIGRTFLEPAFFIVREALPMFQALLLSAIIIAIPMIIPLAMYNWRVVMTLSIAYFGVQYFTFGWEWCRSLESKLLTAMYSSHDFNVLDPISYSAGAMNVLDSEIMRVVLLILYLVIPGLWLALISFAGYQVSSMTSGFNEGLNTVKSATQRGSDRIIGMMNK